MPDPTRPHTPAPPAATPPTPAGPPGPATHPAPGRQVKDGAFDDSVAGEEDPGAGIDTLVPGH